MTVHVGLFLTNQQPLGCDLVAALDEQIEMVHRVREHGWDSVWTGQHYLPGSMTMLQPVPYLARLAAEAGDLAIGFGIQLLALQNPVHVAEEIATLDVICRGRLIYGVGLGYRDVEYAALAVPVAERVRRLEANLDIVTRLWAGKRVSIDLPWCRVDDVGLSIAPVQKPRPPLWMAANSDKAVRRAARLADSWLINPHATSATIERQLQLFRDERAHHGLPQPDDLPALKEIYCAPTREEAVELAGPHLDAKYRAYASWGQDKALPGEENFNAGFAALEDDRFVIGSPDDCLAQLLPWRDQLGVTHFIFRTHWSGMPASKSMASIDLLSREVLPGLRDQS